MAWGDPLRVKGNISCHCLNIWFIKDAWILLSACTRADQFQIIHCLENNFLNLNLKQSLKFYEPFLLFCFARFAVKFCSYLYFKCQLSDVNLIFLFRLWTCFWSIHCKQVNWHELNLTIFVFCWQLPVQLGSQSLPLWFPSRSSSFLAL